MQVPLLKASILHINASSIYCTLTAVLASYPNVIVICQTLQALPSPAQRLFCSTITFHLLLRDHALHPRMQVLRCWIQRHLSSLPPCRAQICYRGTRQPQTSVLIRRNGKILWRLLLCSTFWITLRFRRVLKNGRQNYQRRRKEYDGNARRSSHPRPMQRTEWSKNGEGVYHHRMSNLTSTGNA